MEQTENTERRKLSVGECSQAGHSTKQTTNSRSESDHNDKDVFLSHSGKQKPFVKQLYTDLTNRGLSCFFDQDSDSLPVAANFPAIIFEAAKTCKVAVLLLSKDFLKSKWPMQELAAFVEARDSTRENPKPKILPLFFLISPDALKEENLDRKKWEQLKIPGETQDKWFRALKAVQPINGINFRDGDDEVEFRAKIVKEIWRILPPSQRYHIPHMQGGERMCKEVTNFLENVRPNKNGIRIAGLYGIAGHGKTSLGKAFCNLNLTGFEGKVCHLEFSRGTPFERLKLALQYLTYCPLLNIQTLTDSDQAAAEAELNKRVRGKTVLLVLDNITEGDMDEVRYYIKADLGENSCILLSARSVDLLVNHFRVDSLSCMHIPNLEDDEAIGILLESTSLEVSTLGPEDKALAFKCANRCSFSCLFHPLALNALGRHLSSKHGDNLSKWVAEVDGLVFNLPGLNTVFAVLSEAFNGMPTEYRRIFMLLTIYMLPNMSPDEVTEWLAITCNEEISFVKNAVEGLCKKAFIQEFEPEMRIHDLYIEFAESTAKEMGKWLWWKGDESSTRQLISKDPEGFEVAKFEQCRYRDPSQIRAKYVKNLLLLQLVGVQNMINLDFSQMDSLRSITLQNCKDLKALKGMKNLEELAWLQISKVNRMFELPNLSSLKGLQHLEIDITVTQLLGDLTPCKHLREINVHCPSLLEFPRLKGLPHLKKVEFSGCGEVKGLLDCTNCEMLQIIVLNQCPQMATPPVLTGCKKLDKIVLSDCDAVTACPDVEVAGDESSALKTLELYISSKAASAPRSLEFCVQLENLHLWNMGELKKLPSFHRLSNLTALKIGKCGIREPPDLTCCLKLENVYFYTLTNLERFPNFSSLRELKILNLYNCRRVQDPPDISGCHQLQVFHLVYNDNMKGLPKMHDCPELDEIKVSWHCEEEVSYEGIDPDSHEVDDNFQSCLEHFKDEIPVESLYDVCVPIELKEWHSMQENRWIYGRTMLLQKYFRGVKLYCSVMAAYESYESSNYYSENCITLRLIGSKVIAFPTPGRDCKDRNWLNKVREYFARKKDIAGATAVSECDNKEAIPLPLPRYHIHAMQGETRLCQELQDFLHKVQPNRKEIRIAGLYGMPGQGKTTLAKAFCNAFCNLNLGNYDGKVVYIEFGGGNGLDTQKLALQHLAHCRMSQLEWVSGEDDVCYFFCTIAEGQRVLLVLDNVREDSIDKVRDYLGAELGKGSCILLISRSVDVLQNNFKINLESCMEVPSLTEEESVAILLERTPLEASALEAGERALALKCAKSCLVKEKEKISIAPRFHPLALKVLGRHCFSKHHLDLSKWAAEIDLLPGYTAESFHTRVFHVVLMAFDAMDAKSRNIFVLLNQLMLPKLSSHEIIKGLVENCKKEVEDLYENGFLEEIEPEIRIHDLMEEFGKKMAFSPERFHWRYDPLRDPPMQGEARWCQELEDFFMTVHPNKKGIHIAGLYGMPGQGKTTLAKAFCDLMSREHYGRVCYLEFCGGNALERSKLVLQNLTHCPRSELELLTSVDKAQVEFYKRVKDTRGVLVLDNIETDESIREVRDYLKAELGEKSRILLIARSEDVLLKISSDIKSESCMCIPSLTEEEAMAILLGRASLEKPAFGILSLFCQYAFGILTGPSDKELVQVLAECRGFPLPVQGIVGSNYHKDGLFNRLKTSIYALDVAEKECFLDLAAFQQIKYVPAKALLDIWVYVRGMKREKAVVLLLKFAALHLLHLRRNTRLPSIRDDCLNSYNLYQDDVQRNLALFLVAVDNGIHFRRMCVFHEQSDFYPMRQTDTYQPSEAQIVSVHTGAMDYTQWAQMDFPEAEALVLYFNAKEYCLQPFLFQMEKLKVLIIHEYGKESELTGLDNFQLPSQLRSLHLNKLNVSSLLEHCSALQSLETIRLSQCRGLDRDTVFNFPGLLECYVESFHENSFFLDWEFPAGICSSKSLEVLSITDGALRKLPQDLGMLGSLKVVSLRKCRYLQSLPPSICKLTKLEILDISGSFVDSREEWPVLKETLKKLTKIPSLRCVICDKDTKDLFESSLRPGLIKFVVE